MNRRFSGGEFPAAVHTCTRGHSGSENGSCSLPRNQYPISPVPADLAPLLHSAESNSDVLVKA